MRSSEKLMERPHLVILGAGASKACCPRGDANGQIVPVLNQVAAAVGLADCFDAGADLADFEAAFAQLKASPSRHAQVVEVERRIVEYFADLRLPETPTVYDHLVLSLRPKDVIATFNWDPLLWQALCRNRLHGKSPALLSLHGNVALGVCHHDKVRGPVDAACSRCGQPFASVPLLFPETEKNYAVDELIAADWRDLRRALAEAYVVTIFGYAAPVSDVNAVSLMQSAWGPALSRNLEEWEIIDLKSEDELRATWSSFVHTHHYRTMNSFYDSVIARHPRRSCESTWERLMECKFQDDNPLPSQAGFAELWKWFDAL